MGKVEVKTRGTRAESRDSGRGSRGSGEEEVPREHWSKWDRAASLYLLFLRVSQFWKSYLSLSLSRMRALFAFIRR